MSSSRNSSEKSRRTTVVNGGAVEVTLPTDEHIRIVRDVRRPQGVDLPGVDDARAGESLVEWAARDSNERGDRPAGRAAAGGM